MKGFLGYNAVYFEEADLPEKYIASIFRAEDKIKQETSRTKTDFPRPVLWARLLLLLVSCFTYTSKLKI
jgi:hypothetical protein